MRAAIKNIRPNTLPNAWPNAWQVERFGYPEGPAAPGLRWVFDEDADAPSAEPDAATESGTKSSVEETDEQQAGRAETRAEMEELLAEERRRAFAAGREAGVADGRAQEHKLHEETARAAEDQRKMERAELVGRFDEARERWLHEIEPEAVRLALAIAARILRREAQMDPLLLTGAVRVALGQLSATTRVRLKVPASDLVLWTEAMALVPKLAVRPEIVPGEGMRVGDCAIETELGSVELGVRSQLAEIERGFFDRPGAAPVVRAHNEEEVLAEAGA
jgi:flagellar assembly protein FliH